MNEESYITIIDRTSSHKIDVLFQEEVQLDINVPLFYIKSGEEEVSHYVETVCKPAVAEFVENQKNNTFKHIEEYTNNTAIKTIELYTDEKTAVIADYASEAENSAQISAKNASAALSYAEVSSEQATIAINNNKEIENTINKQSFKYKITNCITEIPQDINLELNNGTLTLKAGSKVYAPNGAGVFEESVVSTDKSQKTNYNAKCLCFVNLENNSLANHSISLCSSGSTQPTFGQVWYNTTTGKILTSADNGTTWVERRYSLPVAATTATTNGISSIDQVFNGFGYIGSTVFALPGVKGLIPNGRNADGSLRNEEFTTSIVRTIGYPGTSYSNYKLALADTSLGIYIPNRLEYQEDVNKNYNNNTSRYELLINAGYVSSDGSTITSFSPKQPFNAVDHNDSSWIAQQAMPSGETVALTLGASGTSYTAPANGWFYLNKIFSGANQYIQMECGALAINRFSSTSNGCLMCMPARKGKNCIITYTAGGATNHFRFIYCEGEN